MKRVRLLIFLVIILSTGLLFSSPVIGSSNWWDKLGEPKYDGTITLRTNAFPSQFDVTVLAAEQDSFYWWEKLFINDWTVDPEVWPFQAGFTPDQYLQGCLAESWEMTDPTTLTVNIRKGIYYANKPPANGREFTAQDVQYHYDRLLGTGSGFTEPNPGFARQYAFLKNATATDRYTVVFKFSKPNALNFNNLATAFGNKIECRESVELSGGKITDWKTVTGTGPWILSNVVSGTSLTYNRNPDYWGFDERHPENRLPYAETAKLLIIPDMATALAGIRTGRIDFMAGIDWRQAQTLAKSNPELKQVTIPNAGMALQFRYDLSPFNDIRVRKALQMAINLDELGQSYYGGTVTVVPNGSVSQSFKGYCYPYDEWPQWLKDEYKYNPVRSKQLLAEAAADGVFEPNEYGGFDTNCVTPVNTDIQLIEIMKSYLFDIGVDVEIRTMDFVAWGNFIRAGSHDGMVMSLWPLSGESSPNMIMMTFTKGLRNYSHVYEPEFEQLYNDYWRATDISQISEIMTQVDKLSLEKHVQIQTFNTNKYVIHQPYLKGYSGSNSITDPYGSDWTLARLWIDKNK